MRSAYPVTSKSQAELQEYWKRYVTEASPTLPGVNATQSAEPPCAPLGHDNLLSLNVALNPSVEPKSSPVAAATSYSRVTKISLPSCRTKYMTSFKSWVPRIPQGSSTNAKLAFHLPLQFVLPLPPPPPQEINNARGRIKNCFIAAPFSALEATIIKQILRIRQAYVPKIEKVFERLMKA